MLVRGRMTRDVITVEPTTTVEAALERLGSRDIRHLPVMEEGRLVGIVSERDLRGAGADDDRAAVRDYMAPDPVTATPQTPVEVAGRMLYQHRIGCLPVVEDGRLVGILTESDLLRALVDLMAGRERHSRLEILAPDRPGELARVVRLIGIDHRINITGVVVPPPVAERALIVLHLETEDVEELLAQLRQLGYEAASPALEAHPD